jgi:hypothetical protein
VKLPEKSLFLMGRHESRPSLWCWREVGRELILPVRKGGEFESFSGCARENELRTRLIYPSLGGLPTLDESVILSRTDSSCEEKLTASSAMLMAGRTAADLNEEKQFARSCNEKMVTLFVRRYLFPLVWGEPATSRRLGGAASETSGTSSAAAEPPILVAGV